MTMLHMLQNKRGTGTGYTQALGNSAVNSPSIFILISSRWEKVGLLKATFTQRHISLQRKNREILNYYVLPRVIAAISYILFL